MKSQKNKMIGIVGGMGPYAGLDLARKIFDLTQAKKDPNQIPRDSISFYIMLISLSNPSMEFCHLQYFQT